MSTNTLLSKTEIKIPAIPHVVLRTLNLTQSVMHIILKHDDSVYCSFVLNYFQSRAWLKNQISMMHPETDLFLDTSWQGEENENKISAILEPYTSLVLTSIYGLGGQKSILTNFSAIQMARLSGVTMETLWCGGNPSTFGKPNISAMLTNTWIILGHSTCYQGKQCWRLWSLVPRVRYLPHVYVCQNCPHTDSSKQLIFL